MRICARGVVMGGGGEIQPGGGGQVGKGRDAYGRYPATAQFGHLLQCRMHPEMEGSI